MFDPLHAPLHSSTSVAAVGAPPATSSARDDMLLTRKWRRDAAGLAINPIAPPA
jgi:hypothetical protein